MIRANFIIDDGTKVFFVGDIHGEITALNKKLDEVGFDKKNDMLFSTGDLIDRGEDSLSCLGLIDKDWFHTVRGNHEQMMMDAIKNSHSISKKYHWRSNGGNWFYKLDKGNQAVAINLVEEIEFPHVIEITHKGKIVVICHADWSRDEYSKDIDIPVEDLLWSRDRINNEDNDHEIKGADLFIFGHTPLQKPLKVHNQLYMDTGAVFGNELSVLSFDEAINYE